MVERPGLLVVEKGVEEASVIPLDKETQVIGKHAGVDIPLSNPYVSRQHARIVWEQGKYLLADLGSKNGTHLNASKVTSELVPLSDRDRIELARGQVVLRFQMWNTTLTLPAVSDGREAEGVKVNVRSREVWVQGVKVAPRLSRKEFDRLDLLSRLHSMTNMLSDLAFEISNPTSTFMRTRSCLWLLDGSHMTRS